MRKVISAGGLIIEGRHLLATMHQDGHCGFAKGHVESGETIEQAAIREVREEAGLEAEIVRYVGRVTRPAVEDDGEMVEKDIEIFLMRATGKAATPPEEETVWIDVAEVLDWPWRPQELAFLQQHLSALVDVAPSENAVADGQKYQRGGEQY